MNRTFSSSRFTLQAAAHRRGVTYVVMLILAAIVSMLGLVFLERSTLQENESLNRTQNIQAKYLAEAAANEAMYKLLNDTTFPAAANVYYMKSLNGGRYGYRVRRQTNTTFATVATVGAIGKATVQESYVLDVLPPFAGPALNLFFDTNTGTTDKSPWRCQFRNTGWLAKSASVDIGDAAAYWMDVQSNPARKELLMTTLDSASDVNVATFDGTFWTGPTELTTAAGTNSTKVIAAAYESQSGHALVAYGTSSKNVFYNVWNGSTWSAAGSTSPLANLPVFLAAAGNPIRDEILLMTDSNNDKLQLWSWDGTTTKKQPDLDGNPTRTYVAPGAIAYESLSGRGLLVWGRKGDNNAHYSIWDGTTVSPEKPFGPFNSEVHVVRLASDPTSNQIAMIGATDGLQIYGAIWNGTAWSAPTLLGSLILNYTAPSFDVAWLADGSQAILAWCTTLGLGVNYKLWTKGTAISSATTKSGPSCGLLPNSIKLLPYPKVNRAELAMQDSLGNLYHSYFDGSSWSTAVQVTSSLASSTCQPYALAALKLGY